MLHKNQRKIAFTAILVMLLTLLLQPNVGLAKDDPSSIGKVDEAGVVEYPASVITLSGSSSGVSLKNLANYGYGTAQLLSFQFYQCVKGRGKTVIYDGNNYDPEVTAGSTFKRGSTTKDTLISSLRDGLGDTDAEWESSGVCFDNGSNWTLTALHTVWETTLGVNRKVVDSQASSSIELTYQTNL